MTWGAQRTEYGSCTRAQSRWPASTSLPSSRARTDGRDVGDLRVGTQRVVGGAEGLDTALEGFQGEGRRHGGEAHQVLGPAGRQQAQAVHELGAVDQGQAFLGLEHQAGPLQPLEDRRGVDAPAVLVHQVPLAHQHQRQVGQGRQVARGAHRPA